MLRSAALATLCLLLVAPSGARALPLTFDFEDGFQGWNPMGSAQRVQTQLLGGEWTIFGDGFLPGGAGISMLVDLTGISRITLEQFFVDGAGFGPGLLIGDSLVRGLPSAEILPFQPEGPGNPGVLGVDISQLTGFQEIAIVWGGLAVFPAGTSSLAPLVSFIDNVTLHPVPEPGALLLLALAAIGLGRSRARS